MKILIAIVGMLAVLIFGYVGYSMFINNPRVVDDLRTNPEGERAARVLLLSYGENRSIPVNYLREGNTVFLGADGSWWRSFSGEGAPVTMLIKGETLEGHATVVLDDPVYIEDVFSRLRPNVPEWLPDWANGKLVVIAINSE